MVNCVQCGAELADESSIRCPRCQQVPAVSIETMLADFAYAYVFSDGPQQRVLEQVLDDLAQWMKREIVGLDRLIDDTWSVMEREVIQQKLGYLIDERLRPEPQ